MIIKCEICGKEFSYQKESSCRAQLTNHIKKDHKMSLEQYIIQTKYNGIHPKCPCGCGQYLHLRTSSKRWEFNQYATDECFGRVLKNANDEMKKKLKPTEKREFSIKEYYERNYDKASYEEAWKLFQSKEFPLTDVAKQYNIDKRTLKLVWTCLNIATPEQIKETSDYYQYHFQQITKGNLKPEPCEKYTWLYRLAKANPGKYTIRSAIDYYNQCNDTKIKNNCESIYKDLKELYKDEIDVIFSYGYHSNEEYEFYQILIYYFGKNNVVMGKKFTLSSGYTIFDFFINRTLLIEYDSDGQFHRLEYEKGRDELKEIFARENNYKFLRLSKEEIKNPQTILKIQELLNA